MKSKFKMKMTTSAMYKFLIYHTYHKFSGIFSVILAAVLIGYYVVNRTAVVDSWMYLMFGIIFLVYEPWSLYTRAVKQTKLNPGFKEPLLYTVSEEGIKVALKGESNEISWNNVFKVRETRQSFLVYTSKTNAFVWIKEQMGVEEGKVRALLKEYVPASKGKLKG